MKMAKEEDVISSLASGPPRETIDDARNDEATGDVINIGLINKDENTTRKDYGVTSSQRIKTTSQDSTEQETTKRFPRLLEEIMTSSRECFLFKTLLFFRRRYGLVLASLASLFFSFENLLVDILTDTLDPFQVAFMHVPILMICCLILIIYTNVRPSRSYKSYLWLLGSGSCQAGTVCFIALAMTSLAVGDTVTILRTSMIQVGFFSWLILKEPLWLFDFLFACLAFGGVIFIARPPFIFRNLDKAAYDVTLQGILFALAGSSTIALFNVFSRKLSNLGVNSLFCIFFNTTATVAISGLISVTFNTWRCPTRAEWLLILLASISYVFAQMAVFYALKIETATIVTILGSMQIIFAFLWQVLFLRVPPFWTSYIGAILIFAACVGITVKKKPPPPAPDPSNPTDAEQYRAI